MFSDHTQRSSVLAIIVTATLMLAGCAAGEDADTDQSEPITVGAVSSITGPAPFPEVPGAAEAVFDRVNAEGGIDGRPIEFLSEDDGGSPDQASQAGRRLVDENEAVALAGSASMAECSVNASLYAQQDIVSVTGTGVEPSCFESENIVPVNNGTVGSFASLLYFASEDLGHQDVCPLIIRVPGLTEPYLDLIERWEDETGNTTAHIDTSLTRGDDPTPAILAVRDAGCDAVLMNTTEPETVAFMNTIKQQGLLDSADWLALGSAYTEEAYDALEEQDTLGLYSNSEFVPFMSDDPALDDWREALTEADVARTSLSIGGYVSAEILVEVMRSIDGEITRESVTAAFQDLDEIEHPLMGMPFTFEDGPGHNPNRASMMVQATEDGWETVSDWVRVP